MGSAESLRDRIHSEPYHYRNASFSLLLNDLYELITLGNIIEFHPVQNGCSRP